MRRSPSSLQNVIPLSTNPRKTQGGGIDDFLVFAASFSFGEYVTGPHFEHPLDDFAFLSLTFAATSR